MDDVVTSTPVAKAGLAAAGVRASLDCADLYALPARLGAEDAFLPQIAWSDSATGGERWLGLGEIDSLVAPAGAGFESALQVLARARERLKVFASLSADPSLVRYVGGIAFDPRQGANPGWPDGEAARFVLPRVILRQAAGRTDVIVLGTPEPEARRLLERIQAAAREGVAAATPIRVTETVLPESRGRWNGAVRGGPARHRVGRGPQGRPLARHPPRRRPAHRSPGNCSGSSTTRDPHGLRFCLHFGGDSTFMGASPERLVSLRGSSIACDCLAGTIARGALARGRGAPTPRALLASEKDGREHRIVLEEILAAIAPHVSRVESPAAPRIMTLPEVLHLWSPIRAQLRPGVGLSELVGALHPTPAVGGSPRLTAMDLIHALEQRSRGWYAGLVGWIGRMPPTSRSRSAPASCSGNRLTAFGGAGIVRGSDPHAEWDETARKAASFIHLFAERA